MSEQSWKLYEYTYEYTFRVFFNNDANRHELLLTKLENTICIQVVKRNICKMFEIVLRGVSDLSWKCHENSFIRFPVINQNQYVSVYKFEYSTYFKTYQRRHILHWFVIYVNVKAVLTYDKIRPKSNTLQWHNNEHGGV